MAFGTGMDEGGSQPGDPLASGCSVHTGAVDASPRGASPTLVRAAMTGLLRVGFGVGLGIGVGVGGVGGLVGCGSSSSSPATATAGSTADGSVPHVSSTELVPNLSLDQFTQMCDAVSGTVETMPHCGGLNTCRGFAYDIGPQVLTQHTCKGTNTCAGWNCIVPSS